MEWKGSGNNLMNWMERNDIVLYQGGIEQGIETVWWLLFEFKGFTGKYKREQK